MLVIMKNGFDHNMDLTGMHMVSPSRADNKHAEELFQVTIKSHCQFAFFTILLIPFFVVVATYICERYFFLSTDLVVHEKLLPSYIKQIIFLLSICNSPIVSL